MCTFTLDPLGVKDLKVDLTKSASKPPLPSVYLSPSRQRFMKEQSSTLFNEDFLSEQNEPSSDRKKKSFRLGGSWLKGFTNSPMVSKLIGTPVNGNCLIFNAHYMLIFCR